VPNLRFVVDANVLIEAANKYYTFDRVPGFWDWMMLQCTTGVVQSVSPVVEEISFPPELVDWVRELERTNSFIDISEPVIQSQFSRMAAWLTEQDYGAAHIAKFCDGADLWIVAVAKLRNAIAVTQETMPGPGTKKVKLPDICERMDVEWIDTFGMLDALSASF